MNRTTSGSLTDGILKIVPEPSGNFFVKTKESEALTVDNRSIAPKKIIVNFPFTHEWNINNINGIYTCSEGKLYSSNFVLNNSRIQD